MPATHESRHSRRHHPSQRHHSFEAMPPHLQYNRFMLHGYRPHGPEHGIWAAFCSLFYLHNETLNIFTHLFGAVVCAVWLIFTPTSQTELPHYWVVRLCDTTALICFVGSTAYHTFMSATPTRREYETLLAADLFGVALAGLGANFALGWLSLPCASLSFVIGAGLLPSIVAIVWVLGFARNALERTFGPGLQLIARLAIITGGAVSGAGYWPLPWLLGNVSSEVLNVTGGLIGALRIPERWVPGTAVTTFFLQSHSLMHCTALWSLLFQHYLWLWRSEALVHDAAALACADARAAELVSWFAPLSWFAPFN